MRGAIEVHGLGKRYRLPTARRRPDTLRDAVAGALDAAGRRLQNPGDRRRTSTETFWALRDVGFAVAPGEVVGVVGANGAGKSTLLKILARITEPTEGRAVVHGRVGSLLEVGTGFHSELTGRENVFLSGAILGMPRREIVRKFDQIVAFAEVERFLDTPVKHYSSGMALRLAFAVAAHLEPEILVVDEVLAVGDARFQRRCLGKMEELASRDGRTVLFVSHNTNAVQRLCGRCLLLREGLLIADAPTREVIASYLAEAGEGVPSRWTDLSGIVRSGSGAARFRALRYSSGDGPAGGRPYPHGPLEIEVEIEAGERRTASGLAVTLYDAYGTKLVNADILSLGEVIGLEPGRTRVTFRIEQLPLNPGRYRLGLWAAEPGGAVLDFTEAALELEVVDVTAAGLGIRPGSDGLVPCRFSVAVEAAP